MRLRERLLSPDTRAVALLIGLWLIFFWRLLTPVAADQASFRQGDFSGQFVAFGGYQYSRMAKGEIPLWNPYNNGGLPFIADTQAAVFYPPRLLTIALSHVSGGWSYNALQMEAIFHVLLYAFLMYLFVRRLTWGSTGSVFGAFIAAVVAAYGGFMAGYPPLQLAILEAAIWLPLATLGILEATRPENITGRWLALTGFACGLSWLAGHPQTSFFMTYLLIAWFAWRCYVRRYGWRRFVIGTMIFGFIAFGVTAITLLPGIEYLLLTARPDLGFDAKGNGFPFQDVAQFIFPDSVSIFSPLYVGIPALLFAYVAVRQNGSDAWFWFGVGVIGLLHSFGANSAFYHAVYNIVPGLRFFRGQERAAFLVANSLAILAGIGAAYFVTWQNAEEHPRLRRFLYFLFALIGGLTVLIFIGWTGNRDSFGQVISAAFLSTGIISAAYLLITAYQNHPQSKVALGLIGVLVVFELFSVNMDAESVYESRPAAEQLSMTPPPLIQTVLDDIEMPFRVDGFRGLQANYGSLYGVMDIRGISPLFLTFAQRLIYRDYVNNPLAWELFAVKYVYSERDNFSLPTEIVAEGTDQDGPVKLHRLANPRPFALLLYKVDVVDSDEFALALLNDPRYNPRESVIINGQPGLDLPESPPESSSAIVTVYQPEAITLQVSTPENAMLSLAHVDYPGWYATIDDTPVPILRAYSALMALPVPAGEHTIRLVYNPLAYHIGAILSLVTWGLLVILAIISVRRIINPPQRTPRTQRNSL